MCSSDLVRKAPTSSRYKLYKQDSDRTMKPVSTSELSRLTGATRQTVIRKVDGLPFQSGPKQAKLYNSEEALRRILIGDGEDETPQNRLAIKRAEEIELNMEVTRRQRIPLDDIAEINDRALQNAAGILKAHEGKTLTPEVIAEIFTAMRELGEAFA